MSTFNTSSNALIHSHLLQLVREIGLRSPLSAYQARRNCRPEDLVSRLHGGPKIVQGVTQYLYVGMTCQADCREGSRIPEI